MGYIKTKQLQSGYEATYCHPISSPSFRLDTGIVELQIAWYKDAITRFTGSDPVCVEVVYVQLNNDQRSRILSILYEVLGQMDQFVDAQIQDPDPEKNGRRNE